MSLEDVNRQHMEAMGLDPESLGKANPTKTRPGDQPLPTVNDHPSIQSMVIADIEKRIEIGIQRYGTALQPNNGRDMLLDAYEEAMDLAIYLKGAIVERDLARVAAAAQEPVEVIPDVTAWRPLEGPEEYTRIYRGWYSLFFAGDVEMIEVEGVHVRRIVNLTSGSRPPSLAHVGGWGEPGTTYFEEILDA